MPSRQECEDEIIAASGGLLTRGQAARLMSRVEERAARTGADPLAAAREIGDEATAAAIVKKRNMLQNLRKRIAMRGRVESKYDELKPKWGEQALYMAFESELTGLNTAIAGGKDAVELVASAAKQRYLGVAQQRLEALGTWEAFLSTKEFQKDVGRELWEQSRASMGLPHQIGITKSKLAMDTAEALHASQSLAKSELNEEGAWIGDYAGYLAAQNQVGAKVHAAGFDQWYQDMLGWIDQNRTFEGVENRRLMMRQAWNNIYTGIHVGEGGGAGMKDPAFGGPGNLAQQISESRIFHLKDADSWMAMMDKYGEGSLPDQIFRGLRRSGDNYALMDRLGTNPADEFDNHLRRAQEWFHQRDPDAAKYLRDKQRRLQTILGYIDGSLDRPISEQMSRIGQGLRNLESLGKLGAVPITHLFSMGSVISKVTHETDLPWHHVIVDQILSLGRGAGDRFGRGDLHDELLAGFDGIRTGMASQWTMSEQSPGLLSRGLSTMLRWSGFNYVIRSFKAAAKDMAARNLGRQIDRTFDELGPNTQRSLRRYGISRSDWETLRNAPDHVEVDGRPYVTPMAAFRADPDNELFTYGMRRDLAMKLYSYFEDMANEGVVTPGAYEKAYVFNRNQPGEWQGEGLRFLAQFKMWGIAATRQTFAREARGNAERGLSSQIMNVAGVAALMTALGYGRIATKSLISGQTPPSPLNPTVWVRSLAQGGGFGIMGDFLDAAVSRSLQSVGETVVGPVLGTGWQALSLLFGARDAAEGDRRAQKELGPTALRVALDNTPFVNLWYTRLALNYAFIWRLQEMMNPGFQRRYEERMKKNGTQFFLSPAAAVH